MQSEPARASMTLEQAAAGAAPPNGGLTVVLGEMSSGKMALGLALARTVLVKGGAVALLQPGERGSGPLRTPHEIDARLSVSIARITTDPRWRSRVHMLLPHTADAVAARGPGTWAARLRQPSSSWWPKQNPDPARRLLLIQDYNVLLRAEPELTPACLRGLALAQGLTITVLMDSTGGEVPIAVLPDGAGSEGAGPAATTVRVRPSQVLAAEAATRVLYVRKAGQGVDMFTLKSPKGASGAHHFELDDGFLVWPPTKLEAIHPTDREKPLPDEPGHSGEDTHQEAPRG